MQNKQSIILFFILSIVISGCSWMYSDTQAPAYGSVANKRQGVRSSAATTVAPSELKPITQSAGAIENTETVAIVTNPVDPYEMDTTYAQAAQSNVTSSIDQANAVIEGDPRFVNSDVDLPEVGNSEGITDISGEFVDPRVVSGQDLLNSYDVKLRPGEEVASMSNAATATATNSITQVNNQVQTTTGKVQQSVTNTVNNANQTVSNANQAVSNANQAVNNTVSGAVNSASESTQAAVNSQISNLSAVDALLDEAQQSVQAGNYDQAASSLERAHRIEPSNAKILYDIAQIRYAQGKYVQAESFAGKSANLSQESSLSKKAWSLIADARRAQGNESGADLAERRASSF